MNLERLKSDLRKHEGLRLRVYRDSVGHLTIGYGRNIEDVGISESEAEMLLDNDVRTAIEEVQLLVPAWPALSDRRREVLANMMFNMGLPRLRTFRRMLAAVEAGDYSEAADEMLDSRWAEQVGIRALDLAQQMRSG